MTTPDPKALIASEHFTPHWIENLSAEEYHKDKTALNSSSAKKANISLKKFHYEFWIAPPKKVTAAKRLGTLVHAAILEPDELFPHVAIEPVFAGKGSKGAREEWREKYKSAIILTDEELDQVKGMAKAVTDMEEAEDMLALGKKEISGYYRDPETGLRCRLRPDIWIPSLGWLVDIKTTEDCSEDSFSRDIAKYGYHFQTAMYSHGIGLIEGKPVNDAFYIVVEKNEPYETAIYSAAGDLIEQGNREYKRALKRIRNSIETNKWERKTLGMKPIGLPAWGYYDEGERNE